jgi:pilus assembly protein FimV
LRQLGDALKHRTKNAGHYALTGVALATACLLAGPSWALGLGRLTIQSALGETLRAEIEVTSITPEEAATVQLRVAGADTYRAAGIDYNSVLPSAQVVLQRRPDGRSVLRVTSDRAVVEPFLDVILELNWASGRLVRAYTLLLDPPTTRPAAPAVATQTAPVITPLPATPAPSPAPAPAPAAEPPRATTPAPRVATAPAPAAAPAAKPASGEDKVRVETGDTLSRIASRVRPQGVSLEQMLVSLYRSNPAAFINQNMNLLRAGSMLDVPSRDAAAQLAPSEARQVIQAQSADFSAYRQRLAGSVTTAPTAEAPARQAKGTVQATVDDRKPGAATAPDKLKLTQGAVKASAPEVAVSKQAEARDAAARVAELARNVEELKKLQGAATASAAKPTPPAVVPAPTVVAAAPPPPPPVVVTPSAPASAAASTPKRVLVAKPPTPAPVEEPGIVASLLDNPLVLPGAGVLVALLVGLGLYRLRGRLRKPGGETSFLESRLQPDSFFGASGGQRIDTREAPASANSSSMSYSLSQLDAIGDVDPVAEADVYLAYGRDLQAEEILKEAMRATPDRQEIRVKLLEVYAKRRDTKGFELLATQVYSMTRGEGEHWLKAQELGRSIEPENSLYQPGGQPDAVMMSGGQMVEPLGASTMPASQKPQSSLPPEVANLSASLDLDLDVDLDAPTSPGDSLLPTEMTQPITTSADRTQEIRLPFDLTSPPADQDLDLDFDLPLEVKTQAGAAPPPPPSDFGALDFDLEAPTTATAVQSPRSDFGDFQLSRSPDDAPPVSEYGNISDDPLARKLELAEEFRQIGDLEGARDLLEEVIAKADGALRSKAQGMLDRLA